MIMQRSLLISIAILFITAAAALAQPFVGAVCTDYATGKFSVCESEAPWPADADVASIYSDAVGVAQAGLIYVVNRYGADNVQVLDPDDGFATLIEFSVGGGGNPQNIAFSADGAKAYVPRQELNDVLIVDPLTGVQLGSIDLSAWNDADGSCELGQCLALGDLLFVIVGRLDRNFYWSPVGDSYLAVIDMTSDTLVDVNPGQAGVQAIALTASNPTWEIGRAGELLHLSCVGNWGLQDGGVELVDPVALVSLGLAVTESVLGGDVGDVAWIGDNLAYAIVSDANFNTQVKRFDPSTGGDVSLAIAGSGYQYTDLELDHVGELFLADRAAGADGLRIFDAASGAEVGGPIDMGLPPYDIVMPGATTGVETTPALALELRAWPNPFNPSTQLRFSLAEPGEVTLTIVDIQGRESRRLISEHRSEGAQTIGWDGRDEAGRDLASGVYFARLQVGESIEAIRLVLLK
jgi:hypothetical protein